ncbi:MAG TPA: DUF434 domain-containing protein, partial [Planctomycetaceae bacterium]|nr:DUF434 domain-containing protein [Planctomycetaceae bacterium]
MRLISDPVMPDTRKHRGPHPADRRLFEPKTWPRLRAAVADLSWLLSRGYSDVAALKLVGDRYRLTERQRKAVMRSCCSDAALVDRVSKQVPAERLSGQTLLIDGFNVLTTVEAALADGIVLIGRDGCYRDLASMHGSYRKVEETPPALTLIGRVLEELRTAEATWYLDRPVSNSGRLSVLIRDLSRQHGWGWTVELVDNPDPVLASAKAVVASADSVVLDRCRRWFNL